MGRTPGASHYYYEKWVCNGKLHVAVRHDGDTFVRKMSVMPLGILHGKLSGSLARLTGLEEDPWV